ncbi:MAG: Rab family GTPase [Candidatus Hermodarchaeota archaeon]|nr:Rab family GTPase [Candidatus Hermodarchaeota archaeon]
MTPPNRDSSADAPSYTYSAKVVVVGDPAVGKTSLIVRYVKGMYNPSYILTLGVNFFVQDITVGDQKLRMTIWDTAGQERFGPIRKKYYKGARGAILVFDQSNPESFERMGFWIDEVNRECGDIPRILVGNKADLIAIVPKDDVQEFASQQALTYVETSAKTGMNSIRPFFLLAPSIIAAIEDKSS